MHKLQQSRHVCVAERHGGQIDRCCDRIRNGCVIERNQILGVKIWPRRHHDLRGVCGPQRLFGVQVMSNHCFQRIVEAIVPPRSGQGDIAQRGGPKPVAISRVSRHVGSTEIFDALIAITKPRSDLRNADGVEQVIRFETHRCGRSCTRPGHRTTPYRASHSRSSHPRCRASGGQTGCHPT